jgi:hypothetical protein
MTTQPRLGLIVRIEYCDPKTGTFELGGVSETTREGKPARGQEAVAEGFAKAGGLT